MSIPHLTDEQLQMYVDEVLTEEESYAIAKHLQACSQCSSEHASLTRLHRTLKSFPVERVGSDFTQTLLEKLGIAPKTTFLYRVAENFAYAFGLVIVLGMMLTAFVVTGVVTTGQLSAILDPVIQTTEIVVKQIRSSLALLVVATRSYLPFLFADAGMKMAVTATLAVGMLALLDKFLKKRITR
jgi:anti-sigma factor RsiW